MKLIKKLLSTLLVITTCFAFASCSFGNIVGNPNGGANGDPNGNEQNGVQGGNQEDNANNSIDLISNSTFRESNSKYSVVDSYELDDGNWYYFYHIGNIDYVPLNTYNADGVYFNGTSTRLEFKMTTINKSESIREIKNAIDNSVTVKNSSYVSGSVGAELFSIFEAKVESGISNEVTKTISNTYSESYSTAISNESMFESTVTYEMGNDDPVGFYFYTPIASVKVYEVVVYNPNTDKIEHMSTYNQFGSAIPGLYYSPYSFLEFGDYNIEFDESLLPEFERPILSATTDITVPIEPNGASCEIREWTGKIGQKYGSLPTVSKDGYEFLGWYADGIKITDDTIAIAAKKIEAKWELITKVTFKVNGTLSVSAGHKLNPFGYLFMGSSGKEDASLDKMLHVVDLGKLKSEGYKMRIILDYSARQQYENLGIGLDYLIKFSSNGGNITTFSESLDSSKFVKKKNYSPYLNLDLISGSLGIEIETKNVIPLVISDLTITLEFTK